MNRSDSEAPDLSAAASTLKDFQRATVAYAFRRMYLDADAARRFLIADEVGLGKTLVARGIIVKTIEHLWKRSDRIDIVYICSNADLARQNINRLNVAVPGQRNFVLPTCITLLPLHVRGLEENKVNFVSFTPGTSFDLKHKLGTARERALLYLLLKKGWGGRGKSTLRLLQGNAGEENFRREVAALKQQYTIDNDLARAFVEALSLFPVRERDGATIRMRFDALRKQFSRPKRTSSQLEDRSQLVRELRTVLANACIRSLQPDLIILDEFQRFKHLLTGTDEMSELAHELFNYSGEASTARVLLLSATPYEMYTMYNEKAEDDHYQDFLDTLTFLVPDAPLLEIMKQVIADTYIRPPNKILITTRHREFKGDYAVDVKGMTDDESAELIDSTASRLGISHLLSTDFGSVSRRNPLGIRTSLGFCSVRSRRPAEPSRLNESWQMKMKS